MLSKRCLALAATFVLTVQHPSPRSLPSGKFEERVGSGQACADDSLDGMPWATSAQFQHPAGDQRTAPPGVGLSRGPGTAMGEHRHHLRRLPQVAVPSSAGFPVGHGSPQSQVIVDSSIQGLGLAAEAAVDWLCGRQPDNLALRVLVSMRTRRL
ncbi:hypothetical protein JX265_012261 [Neoarthrinium moseri]|uniref:Uncharacterized protein n=1 Tax=Neoarthrinium moseri TaxID=1658444 RepID=A0A9P9WB53_9PEZI|nr:hypothetical protein JX265_012261 [Neoarthrinium moseri]